MSGNTCTGDGGNGTTEAASAEDTAAQPRPAAQPVLSRTDGSVNSTDPSAPREAGRSEDHGQGSAGLTRSPGCPWVRPRSGPEHRAPAHVRSPPNSSEKSFPACSKTQTGQKGLGSHPTVISHANDTSRAIWETLLPLCSHVW